VKLTDLKLYLPIILFITFIIILITCQQQGDKVFTISFEQYGLDFKIPIQSFTIQKIILIALSIASLTAYLFYDFSKYFPQKLKMEVYFDNDGIVKCLSLFSTKELDKLNILYSDYEKHQLEYYELINKEARKLLKMEFFTINNKDIHSEGETSIIVDKVAGIHNYHIKESKGELKQIVEKPKSEIKYFYTFFEKHHTAADKLTPSFNDIFIKNRVILKPRFKQIITVNIKSYGKKFDHVLGGYTIIKLFPYPRFSNTLYLLEVDSVGLIPIGYAVYI